MQYLQNIQIAFLKREKSLRTWIDSQLADEVIFDSNISSKLDVDIKVEFFRLNMSF